MTPAISPPKLSDRSRTFFSSSGTLLQSFNSGYLATIFLIRGAIFSTLAANLFVAAAADEVLFALPMALIYSSLASANWLLTAITSLYSPPPQAISAPVTAKSTIILHKVFLCMSTLVIIVSRCPCRQYPADGCCQGRRVDYLRSVLIGAHVVFVNAVPRALYIVRP